MKRAIFNWSGGKDSALALYKVIQAKDFEITKLLTSINGHHNRISMHGVRVELLEEQAKQMGFPLKKLMLPEQPTMDAYETLMTKTLQELKAEGIGHSIFGDIFLDDLKAYRERKLSELGIKAHFPLWKKDTLSLVHEFIDLGFKTVVVCINSQVLDKSFAGRIIDNDFIKDLPKNVDPCGENGEFHTFVFDGPIFLSHIAIEIGETIYREYKNPASDGKENTIGYWFTDLQSSHFEVI